MIWDAVNAQAQPGNATPNTIPENTESAQPEAQIPASTTPEGPPPLHRILTAGQSASRRPLLRTPIAKSQPTSSFPPPTSTRRPAVATPYGQAARKGLEERRIAAFTPGKNRRQSLRQQRETPRDTLRLLSRVLAPATEVIPSSSPAIAPIDDKKLVETDVKQPLADDLDDEDFALNPPRLSEVLQADDVEDDSLLAPPKRTPLPEYLEDDYTQISIEQSRRARNDRLSRLSRGSFGSVRTSMAYNPDDDTDMSQIDDSIAGQYNDGEESPFVLNDPTLPRDFADLRQPFFTQPFGRYSTASGRVSDIRAENAVPDDTEANFALELPDEGPVAGDVAGPDVDDSRLPIDNVEQGLDEDLAEDVAEEEASEEDMLEEDDPEVDDSNADPSTTINKSNIQDDTMNSTINITGLSPALQANTKRKIQKVSKHGTPYPSLPISVIKNLSKTFLHSSGNGKTKLTKDTLQALTQASDWFFEQISEDVGMYAQHAGRKTIDESDVVTLMKRQRQINASTTPFALAHKYLPRELLQELRMPTSITSIPSSRPKKKGNQVLEAVEEDDD